MMDENDLDDDLNAERQIIAEVREFLNRDRTQTSFFDLNNDGMVDFDDLRDALTQAFLAPAGQGPGCVGVSRT